LDPIKTEIRLLILYDFDSASPRRGEAELRTVSLDTNPAYEALSYEWGDGPMDHTFTIGGQNKSIKENIFLTLQCLRHKKEERTLCIDAICINQDSTREKNFQVRQMGTIYLQAKNVLIWLGRPPPHLCGWEKQHAERIAFNTISRLSRLSPDPSSWDPEDKLEVAELDGLLNICRLEYWTRIWIIQEVGLASNASVCCYYDKESNQGLEMISTEWKDLITTLWYAQNQEYHKHF
jgi:hypothetical protein